MNGREWMYTGRPSQASMTHEWIYKTNDFLEGAWAHAEGASVMWCPCSSCANKKRKTKKVMGQHLCKYGFMPDYTWWTFYGEAHRMRDEVVRQRIDDCDADGGIASTLTLSQLRTRTTNSTPPICSRPDTSVASVCTIQVSSVSFIGLCFLRTFASHCNIGVKSCRPKLRK